MHEYRDHSKKQKQTYQQASTGSWLLLNPDIIDQIQKSALFKIPQETAGHGGIVWKSSDGQVNKKKYGKCSAMWKFIKIKKFTVGKT